MLGCGIRWLMIIVGGSFHVPFIIIHFYALAPLPTPIYYSPAPQYALVHPPTPMSLPQAP